MHERQEEQEQKKEKNKYVKVKNGAPERFR